MNFPLFLLPENCNLNPLTTVNCLRLYLFLEVVFNYVNVKFVNVNNKCFEKRHRLPKAPNFYGSLFEKTLFD